MVWSSRPQSLLRVFNDQEVVASRAVDGIPALACKEVTTHTGAGSLTYALHTTEAGWEHK